MTKKVPAVLLRLLPVLVLLSCNSNGVVFHSSQPIKGNWDSAKTISFNLPELDSLKPHNLFLNIRNSNDYKYNNIFLIVAMDFPHGKSVVDTLEYRMANPDGSWMGQGIGSIKENKLWYKENIRFSEEGSYTVRISHAMRNNGEVEGVKHLEGITDVGFTVEETNNQ